ncbi:phosphorylase [Nostoc sp. XA010]|uniref:5'-methylthioadenosine/S-adenosylhomocysteine nucleosidase family protein n=1 Tax=Nostoc sp. XA010 TaxID=2780407 RepID=UPI001E346DB8|nr:phosphorylase [Nostoc sp. XA010]MCC5657470.1 phosphorylase [Nostoc sp. XA010]
MPNFLPNTTILVPQGAEYKAVCRGLSGVTSSIPTVVAIPVGMKPLLKYLQQGQFLAPSRVLIMGICGSLSDRYTVGDIVLYQDCVYQGKRLECDRTFTAQLHSALRKDAINSVSLYSPPNLVKSLTSDRVIWSAAEKRRLGEMAADVVDMEGFTALEFFNAAGVTVAMLRVVSDDCQHDIPDLTPAINSDGSLNPFPLAMGMLRQPLAATRLIRGSLTALKVLKQVTNHLFSGNKLE